VLLPAALSGATALAQTPPAAAAPASANEAMERARRDAANPFRVILEAGRLQVRRRAAGPSAAPPAAATPAVAAPAAAAPAVRREAARPTASVPPPDDAAVADGGVAAAPETAEGRSLPAAAAPPAPGPAVPPEVAAATASLPAAATAPPPAAAVSTPPAATATAVTPAVAAAPDEKPALLSMVKPVIPDGVMSRVGTLREVTADLWLRADGSVAGVLLAPGTPRAAATYLTRALEQWRFSPLPGPRVHRIQLVFVE
jgi:hypothetical protein